MHRHVAGRELTGIRVAVEVMGTCHRPWSLHDPYPAHQSAAPPPLPAGRPPASKGHSVLTRQGQPAHTTTYQQTVGKG